MSQVNYEKMARSLEEQLSEAKSKGDSLTKEVNELNGTKAKLSSENGESLDKTIVIYRSPQRGSSDWEDAYGILNRYRITY